MPKATKPKNIVVIGDTHSGCGMAICPPTGALLDNGATYTPSPFQMKLWAMWEEFWEWVKVETKGEPYDLVHNGDCLEGVHHKATTQITQNLETQRRMAIQLLAPRVDACKARGGRYYHIRGTDAHVGESGCEEENVAKALEAVPNADGNYARFDLRKDLNGSLIHFMHHVGTVSSNAGESTAVNRELAESFAEAARWGYEVPSMICRAHRHRFIEIMVPTKQGRAIAVVGPAWQGKTPFAYRIAGARISTPQFGGYIVRKTDGPLHTLEKIWSVEPSKIER